MITGLLTALRNADATGPLIIVCMVAMWYGISVRAWTLLGLRSTDATDAIARVGKRRAWSVFDSAVAALTHEANRRRLTSRSRLLAVLGPYSLALSSHAELVRSTAAIAPLLGLLGTVAGMIDTFGTMSSVSGAARGEGVASGIAEALTATELGLVVAVPGLLIGALLDRRQAVLSDALDAVIERLVQSHADDAHPSEAACS
jgi:biopolymer transport protein ExbB